MRLFRDEEAARKAGAFPTGTPVSCYWSKLPLHAHDNHTVCSPPININDLPDGDKSSAGKVNQGGERLPGGNQVPVEDADTPLSDLLKRSYPVPKPDGAS